MSINYQRFEVDFTILAILCRVYQILLDYTKFHSRNNLIDYALQLQSIFTQITKSVNIVIYPQFFILYHTKHGKKNQKLKTGTRNEKKKKIIAERPLQ